MTNPYSSLEDYHFWHRAITAPAPGHIDPVVRAKTIGRDQKIATMGSCFAQHLSRMIDRAGFRYFVAEEPPSHFSSDEAKSRQYGIYSARYGNVYTVRQAIQLFDRAFDIYQPGENIWRKGERYIDAFRPRIEPGGFSTREELLASRAAHLACVRQVFNECEWLIFTLGLTETWRSKLDGAVFPLAPGVDGGEFDPQAHEFVNYGAAEVSNDLGILLTKLASVNPAAQVLLTLSPVPLIATYEMRHVLVSTTVSKAALRVAADEAERNFHNVIYFPAYEIVTSAANGGRYFEDDLRNVTDLGVNHVMRIFSKHFMHGTVGEPGKAPQIPEIAEGEAISDLVCDEEEIYRALKMSGL
jgi:GSCFA family